MWKFFATKQWELQAEWTIETVKHLALVNAAGVAGAIALFGTDKHPIAITLAIVLFAAGLLAALLNFWLNSMGYTKRGSAADSRASTIRTSQSWDALNAENRWDKDPGKDWFDAAVNVGWLSALLCVSGGLAMATSLLAR